MKIYLDDHVPPAQNYPADAAKWVWCKSVEECKLWLSKKNVVTHISLDGDMGFDPNTGEEIPGGVQLCDWMRETGNWPTQAVWVHSRNPSKQDAMVLVISQHFKPRGK